MVESLDGPPGAEAISAPEAPASDALGGKGGVVDNFGGTKRLLKENLARVGDGEAEVIGDTSSSSLLSESTPAGANILL